MATAQKSWSPDGGAAATTTNEVPVRPTVFIGIGGTGAQVLLRLRRRILSHRWNGRQLETVDAFPIARFLLIDLDGRPTVQSDVRPDDDPYLQAISLDHSAIRPSSFQPGLYMGNLRNYPWLEEWMPTGELAGINFAEGAGQIRAISRLLFFDQIETIRDECQRRASEVSANVTNSKDLEALGLQPDRGLRAVVVAGLAGGTGSGMFLDVGLFLRSLTGPQFQDVDAYLLCPTLFGQYGRRALPNGFAALAELDRAMTAPPFIRQWRGNSGAIFPISPDPDRQIPFSQCYLFDASNLDGNRTQKAETLYDLMADSLFEDFGTSSFAGFKRSARVNQADEKNKPYKPASLDGDPDLVTGTYSRRYSALGQAMLVTSGALEVDAAVELATQGMLASFFGVAGGTFTSSDGQAQQQDRDRFMRETLRLADRTYDDFPSHLKPRPAAIPTFELVDRLLEDGPQPLDARLADDIANAFVQLRASHSQLKDWEGAARDLAERFKGDVIEKPAAPAILQKKVADVRAKLQTRWFSDDPQVQSGSLLDALFAYIDDHQQGGIDFTMSLIEEVRLALEKAGGPIQKLERAAGQLREAAQKLHGEAFDLALSSMTKAAKGGLFGPDRGSAQQYLENARECLSCGLRFQLRAAAAEQAASLLGDVIGKLGRRVPGEDAQEHYDGLMGSLYRYRRTVQQLMEDARLAAARIASQQESQGGGTSMVIDSGIEDKAKAMAQQQSASWAASVFQNLGKCRALLPGLADAREKLRILSTLRAHAREQLRDIEQALPTISQALEASGEPERKLRELLSWSMPWIERAPTSAYAPDSKQFMMVVATGDARFAEMYGNRLSTLAPQQGIQPQVAAMGSPQTLICYTELSAYPLDYLSGIRDSWKQAYETLMFQDKAPGFPLHTHKDSFRFPPPFIPTQDEIDRIKADLALFLKASLMRVLRRNKHGDYEFNVAASGPANWLRVGSEIAIRRRGIGPQYEQKIKDRVDAMERASGPWQLSALALLADALAEGPYHEVTVFDEKLKQDRLLHGMGFKVARQLAEEWRAKRKERFPAAEASFAKIERMLAQARERWSEDILGSREDVPKDEADPRADKRSLKEQALSENGLKAMVEPAETLAPPPPPPSMFWYVWDGTKSTGPFDLAALQQMAQQGAIAPSSLVAPVGSQQWIKASTVPGLFDAPPPPPPPPPPGT